MATIQGTGGGFTAPAFAPSADVKFQSWTATLQANKLNTKGFGDGGWSTGKIINARVVGTAIGIIPSTALPVPAAAMTATFGTAAMQVTNLVLTFATGKTWMLMKANITMVALERAEEGAGNSVYRISFASVGAVVQTTPWA